MPKLNIGQGDKGKTHLLGGKIESEKVWKDSAQIEACGALDAGLLQGRDDTGGEAELSDLKFGRVHVARGGRARSRGVRHDRILLGRCCLLEADNGRELMDHDLDRLFKRSSRGHGAIGLNKDTEAIEVGPIAHAHVLDLVVDAANGSEGGVERNGADIYLLLGQHLARDVPEPTLNRRLKHE